MPLFLDLHKIQSAVKDGFNQVPEEKLWKNIKGCRCLSSWLDLQKNLIISLIDAPDKKFLRKFLLGNSKKRTHELIPVNCKVAETFLERLQQVEILPGIKDSRFRIIKNEEKCKVLLVWYTVDPFLLRHRLGEKEFVDFYQNFLHIIANNVGDFQGKEILSQSDCRVISFYSVFNALKCALKIKKKGDDGKKASLVKQFLIPGKKVEGEKFDPLPGFWFYGVSNPKIIVASQLRGFYKSPSVGLKTKASDFKFLTASEENFVEFLMKVLNQNYQNPGFTCKEFCAQVGMSKASLYRKCTAATGRSPNALIKEFRLFKALRLLKSGQSVTRTGYDSGFNSPSYFSRCFRQQYSIQPVFYKKLCEKTL